MHFKHACLTLPLLMLRSSPPSTFSERIGIFYCPRYIHQEEVVRRPPSFVARSFRHWVARAGNAVRCQSIMTETPRP